MADTTEDPIVTAAYDLGALNVVSLGEFVGPLLAQHPSALLTMSGTPQQVLTQQFVALARATSPIREALTADQKGFDTLLQAVMRSPEIKKGK